LFVFWLFFVEVVYTFLSWSGCFFYYLGKVLVTVDGNNALGGGQLHTEIAWVEESIKDICDPSAEDCVVVI
jgi:hypothetical protein